jgi:DNA-binding MarR family transcriptional regulator
VNTETFADDVLRTIARANRWANVNAPFTVPAAQLRLLALIEELEPARITALAAADHSSQPGTTAQVNRLVAAGLAERLADASDGRAVPVQLTETGRIALAQARKARAKILAPALEGFTAPERDELRRGVALLERLVTFTAPVA